MVSRDLSSFGVLLIPFSAVGAMIRMLVLKVGWGGMVPAVQKAEIDWAPVA